MLTRTSQQLFDFETEVLVSKGLASYRHADFFRKYLPDSDFVFVPPQPKEMNLNHLVNLIEINGKKGRNYLDSEHAHDEIQTPEKPYLMVNVDDGKMRLDTKFWVSKANIITEGRSPYTMWRGIIHAILFPEVLRSHNMVLVGSCYDSECWIEFVPYLFLYEGEPRLDYYRWYVYNFPGWGVPSCGSVIVGV